MLCFRLGNYIPAVSYTHLDVYKRQVEERAHDNRHDSERKDIDIEQPVRHAKFCQDAANEYA